jgi:hypothetical protein
MCEEERKPESQTIVITAKAEAEATVTKKVGATYVITPSATSSGDGGQGS